MPRDVLVTGFDGGELSRVFWPTLTTVVQPLSSIAADAVAVLVDRIQGGSGALRRKRLAPELQLGGSAARPLGLPPPLVGECSRRGGSLGARGNGASASNGRRRTNRGAPDRRRIRRSLPRGIRNHNHPQGRNRGRQRNHCHTITPGTNHAAKPVRGSREEEGHNAVIHRSCVTLTGLDDEREAVPSSSVRGLRLRSVINHRRL
ncbi:substrate-binding domain-containing protein [Microbacterium phyllosphaerae]|uniref:substrate-binding domain-containing protein n=1 Tax=Microbacterium phyllosphaerae TaxID=124798 RepID=UPI003D645AC3